MRTPSWFRMELETLGRQVLGGDISREDAGDMLGEAVLSRDSDLARQVVATWGRKAVRDWLKSQVRDYYAAEEQEAETGDRQLELYPYLPRLLETSPGRFAHINSMTGPDWDAALRQAEVKADNAGAYAKAIRRAYDDVRHLLDDDGTKTTLQVAPQVAGRLM